MRTRKSKIKVLTANNLLSGEVVYLTDDGAWSPHISQAAVVETPEAIAALEAAGAAGERERIVVASYLVDVERGPDGPVPVRVRELMRTLGPSVRTDLGKQAELAD